MKSRILGYEFWYNYIKDKNIDNVKLSYNGANTYIIHFKTKAFLKGIESDVKERFDTSAYEVLPLGKK